jgi:hypothetical protein
MERDYDCLERRRLEISARLFRKEFLLHPRTWLHPLLISIRALRRVQVSFRFLIPNSWLCCKHCGIQLTLDNREVSAPPKTVMLNCSEERLDLSRSSDLSTSSAAKASEVRPSTSVTTSSTIRCSQECCKKSFPLQSDYK